MKSLNQLIGRTIKGIAHHGGVCILFEDGGYCRLESDDDGDIAIGDDLSPYELIAIGAISKAEHDRMVYAEWAGLKKMQDEAEQREYERLKAKFGGESK